jgi:transposase
VANVNAHDAKKQRENLQASTDRIDLMGIAMMLLNLRAKCSPAQDGIYRNLRTLVRHRRKLVVMKTEVKNRVHTLIDRLFPGFLNEKNTGINPFSKSSLVLMENRFSAQQIRRRRQPTLIKILKRCATPDAENIAAKLHSYAAQVITTPDEYAATLQLSLQHHIQHYRCLQENIDQLLSEIALLLAQTQGAFLTSIKGVGIVLAAGVSSEIGNPFEQKPLNNLTSYCGIIPRVKQSGGIEGHTHTGCVSKRSNHLLKDSVVQSAFQMGNRGPEPLLQDYKRREASGQHADFGIGRRFLRMAMCLMRSSQVYMPPKLRSPKTQMHERAGYYLTAWPLLRDKWKKAHAHQAAFAKDQPLGQWRQIVQELYEIKLKL